jgi:hypothetical protein
LREAPVKNRRTQDAISSSRATSGLWIPNIGPTRDEMKQPGEKIVRMRTSSYSITQRIMVPLLSICVGLLTVQPSLSAPFEWQKTGNLNTARVDHTATLLFSGKVLVASLQPVTATSASEVRGSKASRKLPVVTRGIHRVTTRSCSCAASTTVG